MLEYNEVMKFKNILLLFIGWRSLLFLVSFLAIFLIPVFGNRFPYNDIVLKSSGLPQWLYQFGNFDGVHYVGIAETGYSRQFTQAFFPLYPLLLKIVTPIFWGNFVLAGVVLSSIFTLLSIWMLCKLFPKNINWTVLFFLSYPMSFFLGAIYNEALFLFLVLSCFYFAGQKKWWLVGILGGLASATRLVGVFLLPALIYEIWFCAPNKKDKPGVRSLLFLFLIPLGLLAYMVYLQLNFHDAWYFLHAQGAFGAARSTGVVFPLVTIWRYIKILASVPVFQYGFWVAVWEAGFFLGGFVLLFFASLKKMRPSFLIFSWSAFLLPIFTGTLSSFPRYVMICFPIYLFLGNLKNRYVKIFILTGFIILNFVFTALFTRGYWVS